MTRISEVGTMNQRLIEDWTALPGLEVVIRLGGRAICCGLVDAVTEDGNILWVHPAGGERRLYEKSQTYEAWTDAQHGPLLYPLQGIGR
ncbi:hypothetical protein LFT45_04370 [Arthrobacter sp. FW305-BF8]|uniref:hypothetical protein n=1 Tax=Arthrobacter sp. FW305-BF8 TaxID=2879617 RepID=UPI001F176917|nr:hypothetical protein [Arthrobacter sp. FW305-BF8]UKA55176.1 hypothetical protein LFT45_04370 [Arthrobacter sp. FW305-BF8]